MKIASTRSVKILHTADVHLGLDGYGADPRMVRYHAIIRQAFSAVIDTAIRENVDLLLIAGDLFDSNRPGSEEIDFAVQELRRARRPIVLIPGNHDCLHSDSIYRQVNLPASCTNLHLIAHPQGELLRLPEHDLVIWGRGMIEHEPGYHPLAGLPRRQPEGWHLALAHGFFVEEGETTCRSSPISAVEVRESGWDYLALGHCHAFSEVSQGEVTAYFSGAPSFFPGAPGADGYAALVRCDAGALRPVTVRRIDLRPLVAAALPAHADGQCSSP